MAYDIFDNFINRKASKELCSEVGKLIITTYMNQTDSGGTNGISEAIGKVGADFKQEFTHDSYKRFFADAGY